MNYIKTIFDTKTEKENETDGREASSSKKKEHAKPSNNEKLNKKTIVPGRLDIQGAYELFEIFLGKEVEDRKEYLNTFKKHKISGQVLVTACKDENDLKELKAGLDLPSGIKVYFNQMIAFIKQREIELNVPGYNKNEDRGEPSQKPEETHNNRKRKHSAFDKVITGTVAKHDKHTKTNYGNINVEKKNKNDDESLTGLDLNTTDNAEVTIKDINVKV